MNNEIGRKITSLTLMTIMLAGGMTVAFPGFTPDAYAANANLIVSAENTGGDVDGAQVIEIVVIDEDISASPDITVNGDAVLMTLANDGNWYAYIAHKSAVETVHGVEGISFGQDATVDIPDSGSDSTSYFGAEQNVVKAAKVCPLERELLLYQQVLRLGLSYRPMNSQVLSRYSTTRQAALKYHLLHMMMWTHLDYR